MTPHSPGSQSARSASRGSPASSRGAVPGPLPLTQIGGVRRAETEESAGAAVRLAAEPISVRPARLGDMRRVESLINRFARQNLMLPKTPEQLARNFREFVVAVDAEDQVVGCGALRVYTETLAELGSLAVDEAAHGLGIGRKLVDGLLDEARNLGLSTVFALTLQELFFHRLGFRTVAKEQFPLKVWADCRMCPKLHACDEVAVAIEL